MKIKPFKLERWLLKKHELDVAGGGVIKFQLKDLVTDIDYDQLLNYGATNGSEALRSAVAGWFEGIEADNVLITTGTSEANLLCNLHLLSQGDEYLSIHPVYEQTTGFAESLGSNICKVFLEENNSWRLDLDKLKEQVTDRTRVIFFDNPNNPTGTCISREDMQEICKIAAEINAYVVCDNALRGSELDGMPAATPLEFYERGIITGSLSKLGMTGPRIGWLIGNKQIIEACWRFKDYTTLSHSGIGENLATRALQAENRLKFIRRNLQISRNNLAMLDDWNQNNGNLFHWNPPSAGFTVFMAYRASMGSEAFCEKLLKEKNILTSPGIYFGVDNHIRLNIGCDSETMQTVLLRLKSFMKSLT